MGKTKTLEKHKVSTKKVNFVEINGVLYEEYDPLAELLNEDKILRALAECVEEKDLKGALEIMRIYQYARRMAKRDENAQKAETPNKSSHSSAKSKTVDLHVGLRARSRSKE